jgi:hypothetical protein
MGVIQFQVPSGLSAHTAEELRCAYLAGGYDHAAVSTHTDLKGDRLLIRRDKEESSYLCAPWEIQGAGRLMGATGTLMERTEPYRFLVEMARGKVNQVRMQSAEWQHCGFEVRPEIEEHIRAATRAFGAAVFEENNADSEKHALEALTLAYEAAEALVSLYVEQLFAARHERQERCDSLQCCRLSDVPAAPLQGLYKQSFNSLCLPLAWRGIEPVQSNYQWEAADRVLAWADEQRLEVTAGPLIDFSRHGVPDWLRPWEGDLPSLASYMCDYVETAIARYSKRIRRWVISTGSNRQLTLGLGADDSIRLTARLAEAAWGIDPNLEVVIGLAQPWGEYLASEYFNYSPFIFADNLLRVGLPLAAFELEWHMGVSPRGSFCRDPLEASRSLDLFSMLGCPVQIALSYPSSADPDPQADPLLKAGRAGWWHGLGPVAQAEWAEVFASLALAKTFVIGVCWDHFLDASPHRFPNAGLVDAQGNAKPALDRMRFIRETYLRNQSEGLNL